MKRIFHFVLLDLLFVFVFLIFSIPKRADASLIIQRPLYLGLSSGLVGSWSFDGQDMSSVTAFDRSGNNNRGTLTNGPARVAGKIGQGLSFDGVNDSVILDSDSAALSPATGPFAVTVWFRTNSSCATTRCIVYSEVDTLGFGYYEVGIGSDNKLFAFFSDINSASAGVSATGSTLNDGQWHVVALVRDSQTNARVYLDGTFFGGSTNAAMVSLVTDDGAPPRMGTSGLDASFRWTGLIDDVRIYNRALSADEIRRLYNIGGTLKVNKPAYTDSLSSGLVGSWSFDGPDMSSVTAFDRSGNNNRGTLTNGPVRATGRIGQALDFDGVNDSVDTVDIDAIDSISTITVSGWVKNRGIGLSTQYIVAKSADCALGTVVFYLNLNSTGSAGFAVGDTSLTGTMVVSADNQWHHVLGVSGAAGMKIYVDGILDASAATVPTAAGTTDIVQISRCGTDFFRGSIDEARIYNRALSADEIRRLYNIGGTLKVNKPAYTDSLSSGLVGSWSFDGPDMSSVTAFDRSGNNNRGTLTNGPVRATGRIGQALQFDGVDDFVNALSPTSLDDITTKTMSAWIKLDTFGGSSRGTIISKQTSGLDGWTFNVLGGATSALELTQSFSAGVDSGRWNTPTNSLSVNVWYHVVVVYNNGSAANDPTFYINGASETVTETLTPLGSADSDAARDFLTGAGSTGGINQFDGLIDDARIYNRVLSADEIRRLYNLGR